MAFPGSKPKTNVRPMLIWLLSISVTILLIIFWIYSEVKSAIKNPIPPSKQSVSVLAAPGEQGEIGKAVERFPSDVRHILKGEILRDPKERVGSARRVQSFQRYSTGADRGNYYGDNK